MRPHLEPVDGAAVDEGGELTQAVPEGVADRAEGHHNVQVLPAPSHKVCKQRQRAELQVLIAGLSDGSHSLRDKQVNIQVDAETLLLQVIYQWTSALYNCGNKIVYWTQKEYVSGLITLRL